jgi:glycosyltransferase involved in cell wall biosynthesis
VQVVVNTRMLIEGKLDGIGRFSCEILRRITQNNPDVHFVFLFDRHYSDEFIFSENITPMVVSPQARHPILYRIWFEFSVKSLLKKLKPDLFFSPDGFLSLGADCKQLPVIHDINFLHYPEDMKWAYARYYNKFFPKFARKAERIITVSEYSKLDIAKSYGISTEKIDVAYNGITEGFGLRSEEIKKATREKFSKGQPYFLFVGSMHPRKNIPRLLRAFDEFKKETNSSHKLLLCGPLFWGGSEIEKAFDAMQFNDDVVITGRVSEEDLQNIYASAFALTYVPYFEGFGIPLVEAMQSGIPLITSDRTSMPEVAGNTALLVNPLVENEVKNAMVKIYTDESLCKKLIENGQKRKALFNWDKSAEIVWDSINRVL